MFDFRKTTHWVFDLDNTLYTADSGLFQKIDVRMTQWIANSLNVDPEHANTLRLEYWHEYGTTLSGLMEQHAIDPEDYLDYVHDVDLSDIPVNTDLNKAIDALSGEKIVYTNGSRKHAKRVLNHLGLAMTFDAIYAIEDTGYIPKPQHEAYVQVFDKAKPYHQTSVMVEDTAKNLKVPHDLGLQTVWVQNSDPMAVKDSGADYILHRTESLHRFLVESISGTHEG